MARICASAGSARRCDWASAEREQIFLQSKTSIVDDPWHYDQSYEHIVESAVRSLKALGTDYLDVLLLHRPDALVEPEEVARAFDHLESTGKVRAFGVSNHTPRQIDLLKTAVTQPILANQVQLSVTHSTIVAQGLSSNMTGFDDSITRDGGGIVDYARINKITLQAWSPFQKAFQDGVFFDSPDYPQLNAELKRLAEKYDVTPTAIATAWITRHPAGIQVVLVPRDPSASSRQPRARISRSPAPNGTGLSERLVTTFPELPGRRKRRPSPDASLSPLLTRVPLGSCPTKRNDRNFPRHTDTQG